MGPVFVDEMDQLVGNGDRSGSKLGEGVEVVLVDDGFRQLGSCERGSSLAS
jgi:hypothetical protein